MKNRRLVKHPLWRLASGVAFASLLGACATTVHTAPTYGEGVNIRTDSPLWRYQRVAFDDTDCRGVTCSQVDGEALQAQFTESLERACYQVVSAEEYAEAGALAYRGSGRQFRDRGLRSWRAEGRSESRAAQQQRRDEVMRQAIAAELGLRGLLTTYTDINPGDAASRPSATLGLILNDAQSDEKIWELYLSEDLSGLDAVDATLSRLAQRAGRIIAREASACGAPKRQRSRFSVRNDQVMLDETIYFDIGKATIQPRSYSLLDDVAIWFEENPEVRWVRIEGHTDDTGDLSFNEKLSRDRAQAVVDYLVKKGVEEERLRARGFGPERPIVPNDSALNRSKNRRVELKIRRQGW